ncbi:hypothetical protein EVAR_46132_1 [Eumeta japonica]|uniref:Uncharacterized protein n=1 Tax=Eumeta variegata TaxID=151549 RepID=A0A4C1XTU6_EUMVA|nr:hypothetical protein EVAR_46132_1 [Eumeta japonica]
MIYRSQYSASAPRGGRRVRARVPHSHNAPIGCNSPRIMRCLYLAPAGFRHYVVSYPMGGSRAILTPARPRPCARAPRWHEEVTIWRNGRGNGVRGIGNSPFRSRAPGNYPLAPRGPFASTIPPPQALMLHPDSTLQKKCGLTKQFTCRLCVFLLGRNGRGSEREIDASPTERLGLSCLSVACSALSLALSAQVERDNESCFFASERHSRQTLFPRRLKRPRGRKNAVFFVGETVGAPPSSLMPLHAMCTCVTITLYCARRQIERFGDAAPAACL